MFQFNIGSYDIYK